MIKRIFNPLKNHSFFIFGPRQVGKSTYVKTLLTSEDLYINLLPQKIFLSYAKQPEIFRQEILAHLANYPIFRCIVDEIQKIPTLLDEIHDLIENYKVEFILTGSSARKLKRGAANLLAGRAYTYQLYPLTYKELLENFNLEKALLRGCLPYLWSKDLEIKEQEEFLRSYADTYLREEIQAEGLVRNIGPFVHFLDIAASNDGEIVNYSNIARECAISVKTVQEYYQILQDTFIAYKIDPWMKSIRKRIVAHPKYYLFDTGITNALCQQFSGLEPKVRGRRFEQFIVLQIIALNSYYRLGLQLFFWRTNTGLEVDIILAKSTNVVAALEIKSSSVITKADSFSLCEFKKENHDAKVYIVAPVERARVLDNGVCIIPWQEFLENILFSV